MRTKQHSGKYLNMYADWYMNPMTKAKFADSPLAVMHFLGTLLIPTKDCLERRLVEICAKRNAGIILKDDSLSKFSTMIENNKVRLL
jgi:PIN domain nuclease of toxin-antitoxin system